MTFSYRSLELCMNYVLTFLWLFKNRCNWSLRWIVLIYDTMRCSTLDYVVMRCIMLCCVAEQYVSLPCILMRCTALRCVLYKEKSKKSMSHLLPIHSWKSLMLRIEKVRNKKMLLKLNLFIDFVDLCSLSIPKTFSSQKVCKRVIRLRDWNKHSSEFYSCHTDTYERIIWKIVRTGFPSIFHFPSLYLTFHTHICFTFICHTEICPNHLNKEDKLSLEIFKQKKEMKKSIWCWSWKMMRSLLIWWKHVLSF